MSTRCNVIVKGKGNSVHLYRHYDGYPAECGAVIAEALKACVFNNAEWRIADWARFDRFMKSLLANKYDATGYSPARDMYEFTSGVHGDIEYLYEINFNRDPSRMVRIAERPREWHVDSGDGFAEDRWIHGGAWYSLAGLVERVNRDRSEMNYRIAQRTPEAEQYPMLEAA